MSLLNYFFIGFVFVFLLDLIIYKLHKHPIMKIIIENWGWKERIICVLIWPLTSLLFFGSLLKSIFKK